MSKRLLFVLLTAAMATATLVGFTVPATPANAELRTVTVQLADGSTTTVTVDVPPGTPTEGVVLEMHDSMLSGGVQVQLGAPSAGGD